MTLERRREIQRDYYRRRRSKNAEYRLACDIRRNAIRVALRSWFCGYKKSLKCERCGYDKHPAALQFHHIDPKNKSFEISKAVIQGRVKLKRLFEEIEKCEVVCANCHMIEHHARVYDNIEISEDTQKHHKRWDQELEEIQMLKDLGLEE